MENTRTARRAVPTLNLEMPQEPEIFREGRVGRRRLGELGVLGERRAESLGRREKARTTRRASLHFRRRGGEFSSGFPGGKGENGRDFSESVKPC